MSVLCGTNPLKLMKFSEDQICFEYVTVYGVIRTFSYFFFLIHKISLTTMNLIILVYSSY